jgi:3-oxoacyl-[acyl-carrier protein] reductase
LVTRASAARITEAEWNAALRGSLTVTFLALKTFLPGMVERGQGAIVTMASTAARHAGGTPIGAPTGYAVAKAGVGRLTQEVARERWPRMACESTACRRRRS